jgi:hypothetical protein
LLCLLDASKGFLQCSRLLRLLTLLLGLLKAIDASGWLLLL